MEIRHLRYFIRAAEFLHFTRAAESLYISQPTLSLHIQQMEEELGTQLFARVGRNVRLTEAGNLLLERARQSIMQLEIAQKEIDALAGLLRGTLTLSCPPLHGSQLVSVWISKFCAQHPNVRVKVMTGNSEEIESAVLSGKVDVGFSFLPVEHAEIATVPLYLDKIVAVMARTHSLAKKKTLAIADLAKLPLALISSRFSSGQLMLRYFQDLGVQPQIMVECDDGNSLLQIVRTGELVTFLSSSIVSTQPELSTLGIPPPGIELTLGALWVQQTPASKAFVDLARSESDVLNTLV